MFLKKGLYEDKSNTQFFKINICILQMLYFDRTDVSVGIDVNKTSASSFDICVIFVTIGIF